VAPMKREKQYDMFDVATGACTLEDYLFQRYSENDLSSTFWIDKKDEVDELRPPKPTEDGQPGTEPEVIPIQGPRAGTPPPEESDPPPAPVGLEEEIKPPPDTKYPESMTRSKPTAADGQDKLVSQEGGGEVRGQEKFTTSEPKQAPSLETFQSSTTEMDSPDTPGESSSAPSQASQSPSMEDLLAQFHQATQEYKQRVEKEQEPKAEEED